MFENSILHLHIRIVRECLPVLAPALGEVLATLLDIDALIEEDEGIILRGR
jgi:hypothetical protein